MIILALTKSLALLPAQAFARVVSTGFGQVTRLARALKHRREVIALGAMDEWALKDIGLVRTDISGALASSYLADPSLVLASRNCDRELIIDEINGAKLRGSGSVRRGAVHASQMDLPVIMTNLCTAR
jgi:uncharacterized protein YjiS (DUF1127 family)